MIVVTKPVRGILLPLAVSAAMFGCKAAPAPEAQETKKSEPSGDAKPMVERSASKPRPAPEPARTEKTNAAEDAFAQAEISYSVKLATTQGDVIIDVYESLAPLAAERFKTLVESGFYDGAAFFRVIPGFVAQAGIAGDPAVNARWRSKRMKDDAVLQSNRQGTVAFASAGPNSRTTQFFINYKDNTNLDGMGFAPFGKVRDMTPVEAFYSGYSRGTAPNQARLQQEGSAYLKKEFPKLDSIEKATVL